MLKAISLHTIKQVFETECTMPLSPMAKMSYISCLMYYFEDMPMELESANSFDIIKAQVRSYATTKKYFEEMQHAGLVTINSQTITFLNHWRKHMDKELLSRPSLEQYTGNGESKTATQLLPELLGNSSLFDLIGMRHKLQKEAIVRLIKDFAKEGDVTQERYYNPAKCAKHCFHWIDKRAPQVQKSPGNFQGNILGR